jgi:hypothetical protein
MGWMNWNELVCDRDQWRILVNTVMNLLVLCNVKSFIQVYGRNRVCWLHMLTV